MALLAGQKPDRIPTDIWATPEVFQRLMRDLGCENRDELLRKLEIDAPVSVGAPRTVTGHPDDPEANIWGVRHRVVEYATGAYSENSTRPLGGMESPEEVEAFAWPSADDHDYEALKRQFDSVAGDRPVRCGGYEPFLLYCAMRGMEQAMIDLIAEPEIAEVIFRKIFEYFYELNGRMLEIGKGRADLFYLAEDLGSQHGLLLGLDQVRRWIFPNQKKMADLAKAHGAHVFYHTDGAARDVIPELIDTVGIEFLNPIQWRCPGMERESLVRDFGEKVIFHGAVDNQHTLPFGSVEDVRNEVRENLEIFDSVRYICAPCHNIQPNTPTENIVALYQTVRESG